MTLIYSQIIFQTCDKHIHIIVWYSRYTCVRNSRRAYIRYAFKLARLSARRHNRTTKITLSTLVRFSYPLLHNRPSQCEVVNLAATSFGNSSIVFTDLLPLLCIHLSHPGLPSLPCIVFISIRLCVCVCVRGLLIVIQNIVI